MSRQAWSAAEPVGYYDSKAEYRLALRLDQLHAAGVVRRWAYVANDPAHRLALAVNGWLVGSYHPDFAVAWAAGGVECSAYVEVKGRVARDWPLRARLFRACYPAQFLHVVSSGEVDTYDPTAWPVPVMRRAPIPPAPAPAPAPSEGVEQRARVLEAAVRAAGISPRCECTECVDRRVAVLAVALQREHEDSDERSE